MAHKFVQYWNGFLQEFLPLKQSSGAGDADKIVATGADGRIDPSLMPTGFESQVKLFPASEDLAAGNLVNIWDDSGTLKLRVADASLSRPADGYVKSAALTGANASMYLEGVNNQVSGLTVGRVWLGNAGAVTNTPPVSGSGGISQIVGSTLATTELEFEPNDPVILASA
jgi:hypothetical protein